MVIPGHMGGAPGNDKDISLVDDHQEHSVEVIMSAARI
jgi:hypothetical protein